MYQKLNIPRKTWIRGEGSNDSYLLRVSDYKKCCVGFLCQQLGVPEHRIIGLHAILSNTELERMVVAEVPGLWLSPIYAANDDASWSVNKEARLQGLFAQFGIEVVFFDEEIDFQVA